MPDLFSTPFILVLILGGLGAVLSQFKPVRRSRRRTEPRLDRPSPKEGRDTADPLAQLGRVDWRTKALMNAAEFRVFRQLEQLVASAGGGQRLFSQVSMGEILRVDPRSGDRSARTSAFNRVNAKRVDYLIVDRAGYPLVAIEYQGGGHYQSNAATRDRIKREAFRLAGVSFIEVAQRGLSDEQIAELRRILGVRGLVAAG